MVMTHPKEMIEETFNVFSGFEQTMDEIGFTKFCECSKRVVPSEARIIFSAVVQNVHIGMDLKEFKDALNLLVASSKRGIEKRAASERGSLKAVNPARQRSTMMREFKENRRTSNVDQELVKTPSTFRWSPLDLGDSIKPVNDDKSKEPPSRTIRWCPADLEE